MTEKQAWSAYMRAILRAQDTRHILTWSMDDLLQAYVIAVVPGCSFAEFCKQLDWKIEEPRKEREEGLPTVPDAPPDEAPMSNEAAIQSFMGAQAMGLPVKVEVGKPQEAEPVEDKK